MIVVYWDPCHNRQPSLRAWLWLRRRTARDLRDMLHAVAFLGMVYRDSIPENCAPREDRTP